MTDASVAVEIVGRIYSNGKEVSEQVLGVAEGADTYEMSLQLEVLLEELARSWPEVVAAGVT